MNRKITFPELIELVAAATNTSKRMSELFLKELFATVSQSLIDGESVRIKNLGQFKVEEVKARKSVSVNTGQEVEIPSHRRISFTPAQSLADTVNEPFAHFETVVLDDNITDDALSAIDTVSPIVEPVCTPSCSQEDDTSTPELPSHQGVASPAQQSIGTPPPFNVATPPPFSPPAEAASTAVETVSNSSCVQDDDTPSHESIPAQNVEVLHATSPGEQPNDAPTPINEVSIENEENPDFSIVEFERTKRDIARRSTIRGIIYGAIGMLLLLLAACVVLLYLYPLR